MTVLRCRDQGWRAEKAAEAEAHFRHALPLHQKMQRQRMGKTALNQTKLSLVKLSAAKFGQISQVLPDYCACSMVG
jgi:hypothetical protein